MRDDITTLAQHLARSTASSPTHASRGGAEMRLSSRRELYKLRELVHFLLAGAGATVRQIGSGKLLCFFCLKELDDYADFDQHGNAVGPKFLAKITVHHRNDDHEDNRMDNKALCHTSCHKSYHRKLANKMRALNKTARVQGD